MTMRKTRRDRWKALGLLLLLPLAGLAGCGARSTMPTADDLLAGAHDSLVADDNETARQFLGSAQERLETNRQWNEYQLMTAELDIRTGQPELALPAVDHLLDRNPDDPRVHELAGKVRLSLGDFAEAAQNFRHAQDRYTSEEDIARVTDLLALAEGFQEYAAGRLAAAQQRWGAIQDRTLRSEVFGAAGESPPARGSASGSLARSNQLSP